tara:strand:- start:4135 stop:4461 length:327 start_codon:yes stop_codon:yes gene_type:complete
MLNIVPDIVILSYAILGLYYCIFFGNVKQWYIVILYFMLFKIIFNYDKCTISYYECKLRSVKKENGYLYTFLKKFINIRNNTYKLSITILYSILISMYYFYKGGKIII